MAMYPLLEFLKCGHSSCVLIIPHRNDTLRNGLGGWSGPGPAGVPGMSWMGVQAGSLMGMDCHPVVQII